MRAQDFKEAKVIVFGWARSGRAAVARLVAFGAQITVVTDDQLSAAECQPWQARGVQFAAANPALVAASDWQYLIKNPGIPYQHPFLVAAAATGITILTEVTLGLCDFAGQLLAITGSNGKTTTTSLVRDMLTQAGKPVVTAGNIGTPVSAVADQLTADSVLLLELSSFQLMGTPDIQPDIALITNVFASHLDYHETRAAYRAAKRQICAHQTAHQELILNATSDDNVYFASQTAARIAYFGQAAGEEPAPQAIAYVRAGMLEVDGEVVLPLSEICLVGPHNLENVLAAVAMAYRAGVSRPVMRDVLRTFSGVPHRLAYVTTLAGTRIYNDSKATDIEATEQALASFTAPTIWLAGGLDRGDDLMRLVPSLVHVKQVIAFGETAAKIIAVAQAAGITAVVQTENVTTAVTIAQTYMQPGDVVLLSPAAASWDQYQSFEERGDQFIAAWQTRND